MALTVKELRERLRGVFGDAEDSARTVENLAAMTQGVHINHPQNAAAPTTSVFVEQTVYTAMHKCRLVSARYIQNAVSTISLTDAYELRILKRASPTYSATYKMASLVGNTDSIVVNLAKASNPFTLSSLSSEFELNRGDVVSLIARVRVGGAAAAVKVVPAGVLVLELG